MDWLLRYADRAFGVPPHEILEQYLGGWDSCHLGYAVDESIRAGAASGGLVSALLIYLLEQGMVQGALISRLDVQDGQIQACPYIAHNRTEVLLGQSSIYMEFPWLRQVRQLLSTIQGSVALVGLPCQIQALRRLEDSEPELASRVRVHVALVCGRSSSKQLLLNVLRAHGIEEKDVADLRFREGHWRGKMHVWLRDGSDVTFPFNDFSLYRNLHFFCEPKCLYCEDPLGEYADVVCGDVWLHELRQREFKHSLVISRTPQVTAWIDAMSAAGSMVTEAIPPATAFRAQRRVLIPAKRAKSAQARLSGLYGYKMTYQGPWRSRWNDYLGVALTLFNSRWSANKRLARWIMRIPKPLLQLQLVVLSLLKQF